ncbi:MAG: DUF4249 family protein [Bacteroidota bacterium]|nr:DUF4249 family protein [Bacteroidota bacterium]
MKYTTPYIYILLLITGSLFSCEDDITFEFADYDNEVVVEGYIEEGEVARVFLTRSQSFFDPISNDSVLVTIEGFDFYVPEFLYKILVLDAIVVVSDGTQNDSLELWFDPYTYPYMVYKGKNIIGQTGGVYQLSVFADGKSLSAITTIHESIPIDSLWFEALSEQHDSIGYIHGIFDDPPEQGNYFRVFTKSKGRDSIYVHPWNSVGYDRNINGEEDVEFTIYHGENDFEDDEEDISRWYFHIGEKVSIKFCSIDKANYDFWQSFQRNAGGSGNPFAAPSPTKSNIEGGLGVWGGYGVYQIDYIVEVNDSIISE